MDKKQLYLETITRMFLKYGIKNVGVDDISRELGISKKTLYQEFKDKNEIVESMIVNLICQDLERAKFIKEKSENAIDEIIQTSKIISENIDKVQPLFFFEMEKYYGHIYRKLTQHKEIHIFNIIKHNLQRGVTENLYRLTINTDILAGLFVHKIDLFIDRSDFGGKNYSFQDVFLELIRFYIRGVANENGRIYLKKRIKQEQLSF